MTTPFGRECDRMIAEIDAVLSSEPDSDPVGILDNPGT
jgi:hypothetical protein